MLDLVPTVWPKVKIARMTARPLNQIQDFTIAFHQMEALKILRNT